MARPPRPTAIRPAVIRTIREITGASTRTMAPLCGVTARSLLNWEQGLFTAPPDAVSAIVGVAETWRDEVRRLAELLTADPTYRVVTYRDDGELATARHADPGCPAHWSVPSSAWHRAVVGAAVIDHPYATVDWWGEDWRCQKET